MPRNKHCLSELNKILIKVEKLVSEIKERIDELEKETGKERFTRVCKDLSDSFKPTE